MQSAIRLQTGLLVFCCSAEAVADNNKAKDLAIIAPWHSACSLMEELAVLYDQYIEVTASYNRAAVRRKSTKRLVSAIINTVRDS